MAVAERLLAIQAQDPRGARLAVRARTGGLIAGDVDAALGDRSLVMSWLNRGTIHLVRGEDYGWLHELTTPPLSSGNARRLAQEGVSPDDADRAVAVIERSLASEGPSTRAALRERIAAAGIRTDGQALVHTLFLATLKGLIVRGPMVGKDHAFVLVRDWLGEQPRVDRDRSLAELARRYLAGHGPATDRDLAKWAGLPLRDARAGLTAIASDLVELDDGLVDLPGKTAASLPGARLLGSFDAVLLGWASRALVLGENDSVVVSGGLFRPFALVGGHGVATWRINSGSVEIEPFDEIAPGDAAALEADADDVLRFLGQS